jgi:hypothetical protein
MFVCCHRSFIFFVLIAVGLIALFTAFMSLVTALSSLLATFRLIAIIASFQKGIIADSDISLFMVLVRRALECAVTLPTINRLCVCAWCVCVHVWCVVQTSAVRAVGSGDAGIWFGDCGGV